MKSGVCPKCQGGSILANISLLDTSTGGSMDTQAAVNSSPSSIFFPEVVTSMIRAWVCESCGYTELYVAEPAKLGKAIDRAMASSKKPYDPLQDPYRQS